MAASVTEWIAESAIKHAPTLGANAGGQIVREAIAAKKFDPHKDLNLKKLAQACFGEDIWESRLQRVSQRVEWVGESTEAVDLSAFRSIIGNTVGSVMEDAYRQVVSVSDQLVGTYDDSDGDPMNTLTIPFPAVATDPSQDVAPAMDYPRTGFSPYYVEAPRADKHGLIAVLTLEVVKANRVKNFLDASAEVSRKVAIEQVKRRLRLVLGITQNYKRNGTSYGTYLASGDRSNLLTDFVIASGPGQLDRMLQLFNNMVHPATGEPIDFDPTQIFTPSGNLFALGTAIGTEQLRITTGSTMVVADNPMNRQWDILVDRRARSLLVNEAGLTAAKADTWTALGDFQRAFKERVIEPFHTFEVGPNDEAWTPSFFQDIVYATKARFWSAFFVADPFAVVSGYNNAAT